MSKIANRLTFVAIMVCIVGAGVVMSPNSALAYSTNGVDVIDVHGFNSGASVGCKDGSTFGTIRNYFTSHGWTGRQMCLSFYSGDHNYDYPLHNEDWHCVGWYDSNLGTTSEDIRHLSCLLAWYIWDHNGGSPVKVVAHSMGGVIIRQALFDTPYETQFPPYINVEDVVTAGTPHQGLVPAAAAFFCGGCTQVAQMEGYNALTSNLNSSSFRGGFGNNPQGSSGTDWTNMASGNDEVLQWGVTALTYDDGLMNSATHKVEYPGPSPSYNHGGYLTDTDDSWSATCIFSDNAGASWTHTNTMAHSIKTMLYAVESTGW